MPDKSDSDDARWHLDKRVPVSIIMAIIIQGASGLWVLADMRKDIDVLKMQVVESRERERGLLTQFTDAVALIRADVRALSEKMDRTTERERDRLKK